MVISWQVLGQAQAVAKCSSSTSFWHLCSSLLTMMMRASSCLGWLTCRRAWSAWHTFPQSRKWWSSLRRVPCLGSRWWDWPGPGRVGGRWRLTEVCSSWPQLEWHFLELLFCITIVTFTPTKHRVTAEQIKEHFVSYFLATDLDKVQTRFILLMLVSIKYRSALYPISPYQVLSAGQQPLAEYERSLWPSAGLFLWRGECQLYQSSLTLLRQVLNIPFIISYIRGMTITYKTSLHSIVHLLN